MAHAAFYGLGAYTSALLAVHQGAPFWAGLAAGVVVAVLLSFVVSLPSLRLHGDYFIIATFAFQMIIFTIFNNWTDLTRGPLGVTGIPAASLFGVSIGAGGEAVLLSCILVWAAYFTVRRVVTSPFGRVLRAIREDEVLVRALGKNPLWYKVVAFGVSGGVAAAAGSMYAQYVSYIDPTSFTVMESILVLSMVIIGGAGSRFGPLIGAAVLVTLPEALRFVGLPRFAAAHLRQVLYGTLLVILMLTRPWGLVGRFRFGR